MIYIGELISIGVAFSWTATALLSEFGSKRLGNLTLNVLRMALALVFSLVLFGVVTGNPLPAGVSPEAAGWMLLSGLAVLYYNRFALWTAFYDAGTIGGSLDGVGHAGAANDADEHRGDAGDTIGNRNFCVGTGQAP